MRPAYVLLAIMAVALLGLLIIGRRRTARIEGPVSPWFLPEEWIVATGVVEGKSAITRFDHGLKAVLAHPSFRTRIGIAVPFTHPTENGLPGQEEIDQLSELEDAIRIRLREGNESLFAGVITTGGMREFVFYTSSEAGAVARIESLRRETTHHEIQHVLNDDPDWQVFKTFAP